MEIFRKVPLRGLAYPPGQRQGSAFILKCFPKILTYY
jgi:hypothetical protein